VPTSSFTPGATDTYGVGQIIEGLNMADLGWGYPGAQSVTLSFWVSAQDAGTWGGCISNGAENYYYPFSYYTVGGWQYIQLTIPGPTTGTWSIDNNKGMFVYFSVGTGATISGTPGAWVAASRLSATGANSIFTSASVWRVTGVQLEVGISATPYQNQIYSDQLAECQRYYYKTYNQNQYAGAAPSVTTYRARAYSGTAGSAYAAAVVQFPVLMRTTPTVTLYNPITGGTNSWYNSDDTTNAVASVGNALDNAVAVESAVLTPNNSYFFQIVANSEFT